MTSLFLACLFFLFIHLGISGTSARGAIVGAIGEKPYTGAFALASLGGIVWMCMAYNAALEGANPVFWVAPAGLLHSGTIILLLAFLLGVIGMATPNPTSANAEAAEKVLDKEPGPTGIARITRHPFLWATAIWALFHLSVNGDLASLVFFGTFAVLTLLGTRAIDHKRKLALGEKWEAYAAQTSNLPFAAIASGRTKFSFSELGWWRIALAVGLWAVFLYAHFWLFGVSPFPGGWTPY